MRDDGMEPLRAQPVQEGPAAIRLLIVDDHPIVRFGLSTLLQAQDDMEVVETAATGEKALAILQEVAVDIALVDLRMPAMSGLEVLRQIANVAPTCRCIVLSSFELDEEIYAAVTAGAKGYLHKEARGEEILQGIRAVHSGGQSFPRRIIERLNERKMTAGLSPREREILDLVAKGLTNKEVANTLQISQFTVRNHLRSISAKLEVSDRTEAIFVAVQTGLLTLP